MKWYLNLSMRNKLLLLVLVFLMLLGFVIFSALNGISKIKISQKQVYEENFEGTGHFMLLLSNNDANRADALSLLLTNDPERHVLWLENIKMRSQKNEESRLWLLKKKANNPDVMKKLDELFSIMDQYKSTRDQQIIPSIQAGKYEEAKPIMVGIQEERNRQLHSMTEELIRLEMADAKRAVDEAVQKASDTGGFFFLCALLAVLFGVGFSIFQSRTISRPLISLSHTVRQVANGDLTVEIPLIHRKDEIGVLTQSFHVMLGGLQEYTREINKGIDFLGISSDEILATMKQIAGSTSETATSVSETTATVEEVKQTALLSSQKAKQVADLAQKAAQSSQRGKNLINESNQGMNRIQEQMETITVNIVKLSEQSQTIGEIIAAVSDLADQSNILAVNAAIEAAKAGDQGKGFSVVAQEIRSMAEQSKQATGQIRQLLNSIVKSISQTVIAAEQGVKVVESGVRLNAENGDLIRTMADSILESAQSAMQIAASSQQQLVGMDQVALAMENINRASIQNASGVKQTELSTQNLNELGLTLKQVASRYRVG